MQCRHFLRLLNSPPSPNKATPQTIPGEAACHVPGWPCRDDVFAAVVIVSVVVTVAVPLGVTVAGEKAHVAPAGSPLQAKLTA